MDIDGWLKAKEGSKARNETLANAEHEGAKEEMVKERIHTIIGNYYLF